MKRSPRSLLVLLSLSLSLLALPSCRKANASPTTGPGGDAFVVHEWGTFTSFQGADGVTVDGMQHETEALPAFVHSRVSAEASPLAVLGDPSRDVPVHHCQSKMETPVIYFHTNKARHVKVDVTYTGLLTQWYPKAAQATPLFKDGGETHNLENIKTSSLTWELDLMPKANTKQLPAIPNVGPTSDWQKAREVDAAYVTATGGAGSKESDQYVFYRGLMRTAPQPTILPSASNNDEVTIMNSATEPLHAAFVLDMRDGQGRFASVGNVAPGVPKPVSLAGAPMQKKEETVANLAKAVTTALEAEGLFADEAKAMVRTWSEAWFSSKGTRVIYLVPRPVTDKILPLAISPTPDTLVRVIVGRIEFLTHTRRDEIAADVLAAGSGRSLGDPNVNQALMRIANLGRFAEPATRSVAGPSPSPQMRDAASRVLGRVMRY